MHPLGQMERSCCDDPTMTDNQILTLLSQLSLANAPAYIKKTNYHKYGIVRVHAHHVTQEFNRHQQSPLLRDTQCGNQDADCVCAIICKTDQRMVSWFPYALGRISSHVGLKEPSICFCICQISLNFQYLSSNSYHESGPFSCTLPFQSV